MSDKSHIEWTDATWNVVTGCTKVSPGCKNCYAEREWVRFAAQRKTRFYGRKFTDVQAHMDLLDLPLRWKAPRKIFVNPRGDLFHEAVSDEFISDVFAHMAYARQHTFQILTKRSERMRDLLSNEDWNADLYDGATALAHETACEILGRRGEFNANNRRRDDIGAFDPALPLANVWLGISAEDQKSFNERWRDLAWTPAARRFVSLEPLLGPVDIDAALTDCAGGRLGLLHQVIVGGESGPKARPSHPEWFRSLRDQCKAAGVPFFFKQWGEWAPAAGQRRADKLIYEDIYVRLDGTTHGIDLDDHERFDASDEWMWRAGKRAAGRQLDGREHSEYPA